MFSWIKGSLAYRLPNLYRALLSLKHLSVAGNKKRSDIRVLMMTGKNHLDMTRLALLSIANTWSVLPKIIVITDGTITSGQIVKELDFWPGELVAENWENIAKQHTDKSRDALVAYGNLHPFGKKLAIILHYAEKSPVVWIDSDILFFNDFIPFIPKQVTGFACGGTEDFTAAYDDAVIKQIGTDLYSLYQFNAGLLYASGQSIYEDFDLERILKAIHPNYDFCTEQTLFAWIASKSMGILWPGEIVKSFHADNQQIKPMPVNNTIARHYTSNVRHLFWRDAFFNL